MSNLITKIFTFFYIIFKLFIIAEMAEAPLEVLRKTTFANKKMVYF